MYTTTIMLYERVWFSIHKNECVFLCTICNIQVLAAQITNATRFGVQINLQNRFERFETTSGSMNYHGRPTPKQYRNSPESNRPPPPTKHNKRLRCFRCARRAGSIYGKMILWFIRIYFTCETNFNSVSDDVTDFQHIVKYLNLCICFLNTPIYECLPVCTVA